MKTHKELRGTEPYSIGTQLFKLALVDNNTPWVTTINISAPNTPGDAHVRQVGHLYPPHSSEGRRNIVLMNGIQGEDAWKKALSWMRAADMSTTTPRDVFALSRIHPNLNHDLQFKMMYVVATETCQFMGDECAVRVWWDGNKRRAGLPYTRIVKEPFAWFAFIEKT